MYTSSMVVDGTAFKSQPYIYEEPFKIGEGKEILLAASQDDMYLIVTFHIGEI